MKPAFMPLLKCTLIVLAAVVATKVANRFVPYDDTDDKPTRSGMRLYTDHGTGCQYLSPGVFGGLTPRARQDGTHYCDPSLTRNQEKQ